MPEQLSPLPAELSGNGVSLPVSTYPSGAHYVPPVSLSLSLSRLMNFVLPFVPSPCPGKRVKRSVSCEAARVPTSTVSTSVSTSSRTARPTDVAATKTAAALQGCPVCVYVCVCVYVECRIASNVKSGRAGDEPHRGTTRHVTEPTGCPCLQGPCCVYVCVCVCMSVCVHVCVCVYGSVNLQGYTQGKVWRLCCGTFFVSFSFSLSLSLSLSFRVLFSSKHVRFFSAKTKKQKQKVQEF